MRGKTLGHYEIVDKLGAGGMGEVYRARDTRLDREVAVKVLPEALAQDQERLTRFEREAKMLAALNHGNIAAVHGFEQQDGVVFLVQELIEGEPLSDLLERERPDLTTTLKICRQIADALEAAHAANIVHRDLKPANVMVTDDGRVKVLDFGLARPVIGEDGDAAGPRDLSESPTITGTFGERDDVIMGTAAYMSPDQARGKQVDQRTDVWSFGCVMYEMLSGSRAFDGDTLLDTLAGVVRADVDWDRLPADTPPKLRALLKRCLADDPRRRQRDIGDVRIEIEEVLEDPRRTGIEEPTTTETTRSGSAAVTWGLAVLSVASMALAAWLWWMPAETPRGDVARTALTIEEGQEIVVDPYASLAISPDGDLIAYVAERDNTQYLYLRRLAVSQPTEVTGSEGATSPFFSPDGEWVAFFAGSKLKKVAVGGGNPIDVCDVPTGNFGGTWLDDGTVDTIVFAYAFTGDGLHAVPASGGDPVPITTPDETAGEIEHRWPRALPDGRGVLFSATDSQGSSGLRLLSRDGPETAWTDGEIRGLPFQTAEAFYLATGHLLYARAGSLVAVPFDLDTLQATGSAFSVLDSVYFDREGRRAFLAVSAEGTLVYVPGHQEANQDRLVWVDRSGAASVAVAALGSFGHPQLSPDGSKVAVDLGAGTPDGHIRTYDLRNGTMARLTFKGRSVMPVWSPDGRLIAYSSDRDGAAALYWVLADGSAEESDEPIYDSGDVSSWIRSWSPNQAIAFYRLNTEAAGRDLWVLTLPGFDAEEFLATPFNERSPAFSPDGGWVAYVSNESGRDEVYVRSYPDAGNKIAISDNGGREPVWSRDGTELFYRNRDGLYAVPIGLGRTLEAGEPVELFTGRYRFDNIARNQYYDVAPDGRFLMIQPSEDSNPDHLHLVLNWFEELRGSLP